MCKGRPGAAFLLRHSALGGEEDLVASPDNQAVATPLRRVLSASSRLQAPGPAKTM